jgi:hypothetical protein
MALTLEQISRVQSVVFNYYPFSRNLVLIFQAFHLRLRMHTCQQLETVFTFVITVKYTSWRNLQSTWNVQIRMRMNIFVHVFIYLWMNRRCSVVGWRTVLQAGRSRVRFPMRIFNLPNPSIRTMALGSTQPLTEMSTRNLPGDKGRPDGA